jgi:hypothetical protein
MDHYSSPVVVASEAATKPTLSTTATPTIKSEPPSLHSVDAGLSPAFSPAASLAAKNTVSSVDAMVCMFMSYVLLVTHVMVCGKLTVNNNTSCFATIDKVFYYVAAVLTTCFGPYIRPSSGEFTKILKRKHCSYNGSVVLNSNVKNEMF